MNGIRHSKQRDAILAELCSRYDHPTADEIYSSLKGNMPNLSLATVYRNLALLSQQGTIAKLSYKGMDHFDGNTAKHYHLLCNSCNRYYDINMPAFAELEKMASSNCNGEIYSHSIIFYGLCENCSR